MKYLIFLSLILTLIACDKGPKTPEGLIKMFVTDLSSKKVEKSYFEQYTTGELWDAVKDLDEEEFNNYANGKKVKKVKLKILNKNCVGDTCNLTYEVGYAEGKGAEEGKGDFHSEVKKVAVVVKQEDSWKIYKVSNIKTYIEAQNTIEVGPEN